MKIVRVPAEERPGIAAHFEVQDAELPPPSDSFRRFVREVKGFGFLNTLTLPAFEKQVRERYAKSE